MDAYAGVVEYMSKTYYGNITRFTTSAFLRDKLGKAIFYHSRELNDRFLSALT